MTDEPQRLRNLLGEFGRRMGMLGAAETGVLFRRWADIVGNDIARHAEPTSVKGGVLRIRTSSAIWATEVGYLGPEIVRRTNELVGRELVTEVRVWTGPGPISTTPPQRPEQAEPNPPRRAREDPLEAFRAAYQAWRSRH